MNPHTGELLEPVPPGYEVLKHDEQLPNGKPQMEAYVVKKKPENGLSGDIVKSAMVQRGTSGLAGLNFA